MNERVPYTDPLTPRERFAAWRLNRRFDIVSFWDHRLWTWLVARMPRRLILFAYIRVVSNAWVEAGNKHPDEIGYREAYEAWQSR